MRITKATTALLTSSLLPLLLPAVAAWGETPQQAASRARSLLSDPTIFGVATLSTPYPSDYPDPFLANSIASGPEYFADCFEDGDLLFVALTVSQNWRNVLQHPNATAVVSITSNPDPSVVDPRHSAGSAGGGGGRSSRGSDRWDPSRPTWRRGMPSKQRITLFGNVVELDSSHDTESRGAQSKDLSKCFLSQHPDAAHWAPGAPDSPHIAKWVRFNVQRVYRVGGFGDESAIGWIPIEDWRSAEKGVGVGAGTRNGPFDAAQTEGDVKRLFEENVDVDDGLHYEAESSVPRFVRQHL